MAVCAHSLDQPRHAFLYPLNCIGPGPLLGAEDARRPLGSEQRIPDIAENTHLDVIESRVPRRKINAVNFSECSTGRNESLSMFVQKANSKAGGAAGSAVHRGGAADAHVYLLRPGIHGRQNQLTHPFGGRHKGVAAVFGDEGQSRCLGHLHHRPARG